MIRPDQFKRGGRESNLKEHNSTMYELEKNKSSAYELTLAVERYSRCIFNELLRLQSLTLPPSSQREVYRFINSYTFQQYTKLPKLVSDALFGCFSQKGKCDSMMFYTGLQMLLHDIIEESCEVTFAMLDSDSDNCITRRECELMLNHSVASPSLIRHAQILKLKRIIQISNQNLFGEKEYLKKQDYIQKALNGQNNIHSMLWGFVREHFNVTEYIQNLISLRFSDSDERISDNKTEDSLTQACQEGYLLREEIDSTLTKRFYRLINRELLEFDSSQALEYCSLRYLGTEAFLQQVLIKDGTYYKFVLRSGADTMKFCAESLQEHDYWVQGIKRVIGRHNYRRVNDVYCFKRSREPGHRRAKSWVDSSSVVIRTIEKCNLDFEGFKQTREEIEILEMCNKEDKITKLIDYFEDSEAFYLVFQPTTGISLKQYFLEEQNRISSATVRALTKELCNALSFMSKYNILHRNINPSSIFLTRNELLANDQAGRDIIVPQIQLGDFSCSTILRYNQEVSKLYGLASFVAPEAIKFNSYGYSSDMYSLGATIYFLMTGSAPYSASDMSELYKKILNKQPEFSVNFLLNSASDLVRFVTALVVKNPKHRLSIKEVMMCFDDAHRIQGIPKVWRSAASVLSL